MKRMYLCIKVGMQADPALVERVPHLPFLKEADARQGFVEYPDFLRLRFAAESGAAVVASNAGIGLRLLLAQKRTPTASGPA